MRNGCRLCRTSRRRAKVKGFIIRLIDVSSNHKNHENFLFFSAFHDPSRIQLSIVTIGNVEYFFSLTGGRATVASAER
jgi:hypothetical protein